MTASASTSRMVCQRCGSNVYPNIMRNGEYSTTSYRHPSHIWTGCGQVIPVPAPR